MAGVDLRWNNSFPRWRPDGKELFFDNSGTMVAVDLTGTVPGGAFKAGVPERLFQGLMSIPPHNYDVAPDGRRFLVVSTRGAQDRPAPIVVVLNWNDGAELRGPFALDLDAKRVTRHASPLSDSCEIPENPPGLPSARRSMLHPV